MGLLLPSFFGSVSGRMCPCPSTQTSQFSGNKRQKNESADQAVMRYLRPSYMTYSFPNGHRPLGSQGTTASHSSLNTVCSRSLLLLLPWHSPSFLPYAVPSSGRQTHTQLAQPLVFCCGDHGALDRAFPFSSRAHYWEGAAGDLAGFSFSNHGRLPPTPATTASSEASSKWPPHRPAQGARQPFNKRRQPKPAKAAQPTIPQRLPAATARGCRLAAKSVLPWASLCSPCCWAASVSGPRPRPRRSEQLRLTSQEPPGRRLEEEGLWRRGRGKRGPEGDAEGRRSLRAPKSLSMLFVCFVFSRFVVSFRLG